MTTMQVTSAGHADARGENRVLLLLIAFTAMANMALQWTSLINPDVAVLTWAADRVMGGAVFGVDVYEVAPPLCFMIYAPAVLLAKAVGIDLALKLWITFLACLSLLGVWQSCDEKLRLPVSIALALFVSLGFLGQFGQREHVALMLCAPYAAGHVQRRGGSIANGMMAGIGFAIKPYFLIPLAFVFLTRRRIRAEEIAIAITGAIYAIALAAFFRPYVFEFLPMARATYWAFGTSRDSTLLFTAIILLCAIPLAAAGSPQPASRGLLAATIGFTAAALVQYKGFAYHFHAAFGFLALYLAARLLDPKRIVAICSALFLLVYAVILGNANLAWIDAVRSQKATLSALKAEIDDAPSFISLIMDSPFPTFPLAAYTPARYEGLAIMQIFAPAVRNTSQGPEANAVAAPLAIGQAVRELQRKPARVIVKRDGSYFAREEGAFDFLAWLSRDAAFRELWADYTFDTYAEGYAIYRLKEPASP